MLIQKIAAFSLLCAPLLAGVHPEIPSSAIAQFPCTGVLREAENGFVYLDIDDNYIHELIHFIEAEGFEEPPYFINSESAGAHISVIYADEIRQGSIEEAGQTFSFTPLSCKIVRPPHWDGVEEIYLIEVDAPELNAIREKHGLGPSEFGFHITVGIKPY